MLFIFAASIAASIVDEILGTAGVVGMVVSLGLLVPNVAVTIRRLHDIDKSGWYLLAGVIPVLGWIYLIYLYLQPGTPGANRFGEPAAAPATT